MELKNAQREGSLLAAVDVGDALMEIAAAHVGTCVAITRRYGPELPAAERARLEEIIHALRSDFAARLEAYAARVERRSARGNGAEASA